MRHDLDAGDQDHVLRNLLQLRKEFLLILQRGDVLLALLFAHLLQAGTTGKYAHLGNEHGKGQQAESTGLLHSVKLDN